MSWIKDNKFMAALGGGTLAGAVLLYFAGSAGTTKYTEAKEKYDADAAEAASYERLPLYPTIENKNEKSKALGEYRKATESLQAAFEAFRPKELKKLTPLEFSNHLVAANTEIRNAFKEGKIKFPESFFVGFERYQGGQPSAESAALLDYQLDAIKSLMLALAKAKPEELKNVYRPGFAEEDRQANTLPASAVARPFPLEITFSGTEKSVREFLSAVAKPDKHYFVIRSLRISNLKKDPPKTGDAQFEKPAAAPTAGDTFGGAFVIPDTDASAGAPASGAETPKPADTSRILAQVLGNEQIQVFVHLDLLQFLPAKKLP